MGYDLILVGLFLVVLLMLAWPIGHYLVRVFQDSGFRLPHRDDPGLFRI